MEPARYFVSTDGYRSSAGVASWAFVVEAEGAPASRSGRITGDATSHLAEWVAVTEALAWIEAHAQPGDVVELRTDSALVDKGLASRRPEMSGEAGERRAAARQTLARLAQQGIKVKVARVPRTDNTKADEAARAAAEAG